MYHDGDGLYLTVQKTGSKQWSFRYMRERSLRSYGLGGIANVSLADARQAAHELRKLLASGVDPLAHKREQAATALIASLRPMLTFAECQERVIEARLLRWRTGGRASTEKNWRRGFRIYVNPTLGTLPVAKIDAGLVLSVLRPIWTKIPDMAEKIRQRIAAVLDWAELNGYRSGPNPAQLTNNLDKELLPKHAFYVTRPHKSLPYEELPEMWQRMMRVRGNVPWAMGFLILTAVRENNAFRALWPQIDMANALWTIPADQILAPGQVTMAPNRWKTGVEHVVPLSTAAMKILHRQAAIRQDDWIFPGQSVGKSLSSAAGWPFLRANLDYKGENQITVHGFRSTFNGWAVRHGYSYEARKLTLGQVVGRSRVDRAYFQDPMIGERRAMLEQWGRYCTGTFVENVVPLPRALPG